MNNKIISLIKEITFKSVTESQPLVSSNLLDSVAMVDLVLALEEEFGVELGIEDLTPEKLESVACIAMLVNDKLAAACQNAG